MLFGEMRPILRVSPKSIKGIILFNPLKGSFWVSSQLKLDAFKMAHDYFQW